MADKAAFRAEWKRRERELSPGELAESNGRLCRRFLALPQVEEARTVLLFFGMGAEVDTRPLLEELTRRGKRVLLPRCLSQGQMEARRYAPDRLTRHQYGMLEPGQDCERVEKSGIDLILVPALCYDTQCYRMGRGGGFYDRYLTGFAGATVGLCRDALLCGGVPREPWDRPVELVLTETKRFCPSGKAE